MRLVLWIAVLALMFDRYRLKAKINTSEEVAMMLDYRLQKAILEHKPNLCTPGTTPVCPENDCSNCAPVEVTKECDPCPQCLAGDKEWPDWYEWPDDQ